LEEYADVGWNISFDAALLMSSEIVTVTPETSVSEVARIMLKNSIGSIAVKKGGKIVGIITDRDFTRCAAMEKHASRAEELMSSPVITVDYRENVLDIARKMGDCRIRHIFVEKDGDIVGIISLRDILKAIPEAIYCYIPHLEKDKRR
jgi:CBS domain-containing protein